MPAVPPFLTAHAVLSMKMQSHFLPFNAGNASMDTRLRFHHALMGPFAYRFAAGLSPAPALFEPPRRATLSVIAAVPYYNAPPC